MLDIRTPIGLLFLILGALLGIYGLLTPAQMYRVSLGINLNLLWGASMAAFGITMLIWQRWSPQVPSPTETEVVMTIPPEIESLRH